MSKISFNLLLTNEYSSNINSGKVSIGLFNSAISLLTFIAELNFKKYSDLMNPKMVFLSLE